MKAKLLISLIVLALASLSCQHDVLSEKQQIQNFVKCGKTEAMHEISNLVYDLYYSKFTFPTFIEKLFEWNAKAKVHFSQCLTELQNLPNLVTGTPLTKLGLSLLYTTNCSKDLGPALIVLDNVIANIQNIKGQWKQLLTNGLTFAIISYQSFKDCKAAAQTIAEIWRN